MFQNISHVVCGVHGLLLNTEIEDADHEARRVTTVSSITRNIARTVAEADAPYFIVNQFAGRRSADKFLAIADCCDVELTAEMLKVMSAEHRRRKDQICYQTKIDTMPGAVELLQSLKIRGITPMAITSDPVDRGIAALTTAGLMGCFDAENVFGMTEGGKKPSILKAAITKAGVAPENILFIDDGISEIRIAADLGMVTVGFVDPLLMDTCQQDSIRQFEEAGADAVIRGRLDEALVLLPSAGAAVDFKPIPRTPARGI